MLSLSQVTFGRVVNLFITIPLYYTIPLCLPRTQNGLYTFSNEIKKNN